MKKVCFTSSIFAILCIMMASCGRVKNPLEQTVYPQASGAFPVTTSGQAAEAEEDLHENQTYIKSTFVNMSGRKQVLDLGWIDLKEQAIKLEDTPLLTMCKQVREGDYYYVRKKQDETCISLYRNQAEKVCEVEWEDEEGSLYGAASDGTQCYFLCSDMKALREEDIYKDIIKCVNLKTQSVETISIGSLSDEIWLMRDFVYVACSNNESIWNCYDKMGKRIDNLSYEDMDKNNVKQVIDGKVYYIEQAIPASGDTCFFVQVDLRGKKQKVLFEYMPNLKGEVTVSLFDMDEEGIYVMESNAHKTALFQIPLQGGRMKCLIKKSNIQSITKYNKYRNHLVYVDKKNRIHNVNLKKQKDIVICNSFQSSIHSLACARDGIYIMCDADWLVFDDDDDWMEGCENDLSLELYYMDYQGRNQTKLAEANGP